MKFRSNIHVTALCASAAIFTGCSASQSQGTGNAQLVPSAVSKLVVTHGFSPRSAHSRERVLYNFRGGDDGANPWGALLADNSGNLFGTTRYGGAYGDGTIFEVERSSKKYTEKVVHAFYAGKDGASPWAALLADSSGALYTTTGNGGPADDGAVVKLVGKRESVRYAFKGGDDGAYPVDHLTIGTNGTLYGTTEAGGASGVGTAFGLATGKHAERVLYSFKSSGDGQSPHGSLLPDASGALYGTTTQGGTAGAGTAFKLTPSGAKYREAYLFSFSGANGAIPNAGFIADASGALYSTATWGGSGSCYYGFSPYEGCGVIFKLSPKGSGYTESTLYDFQNAGDGAGPNGDLLLGAGGTLYGTTQYGGTNGKGTVFALAPHGKKYVKTTLWEFGGPNDGAYPAAGLIADASGALYGTTVQGGLYGSYFYSYGTVFEIKP
jgi:uncharacterized repeat protein (TIGR03803 family)